MSTNAGVPVVWPSYKPGANHPANTTASSAIPAAKAAAADDSHSVLRMLGLPRIKPRLPSRNWMIFLSVTGSFTAAVLYDKYQKKRLQQKWCDLVRPLSKELLPPDSLPRKITIYIAAPPGDGLRSAREHFYEYVKPVLVAGAMDWEVVEGRREGDVRFGTAERIRRRRRRSEGIRVEEEDEAGTKWEAVLDTREKAGTKVYQGEGGDLIIGRHTWKEYVRGLHEGWLGPLQEPKEIATEPIILETTIAGPNRGNDGSAYSSVGDVAVDAAKNIVEGEPVIGEPAASDDASTSTTLDDASPQAPKKPDEEDKPKPKNLKPPPYISTAAYNTSSTPASIPQTLDPAAVITFPHILGFLNTPIRTVRFLNRRRLADDIGRQTAALVMAAQHRPFSESVMSEDGYAVPEQDVISSQEEREWPKSVRQRERKEDEESVWLDKVVVDQRIGDRMRMWELRRIDEARAEELLKDGPKEEPREETE